MRRILPFLLLLMSCSEGAVPEAFNAQAKADAQAAKERAADNRAVQAGFKPEAPAPLATVSVDPPKTPAPGAILPASDRQYRYIGRWAAAPGLCTGGTWRFQTRKLTTAGETSCEYPTVSAVPNGYRLNGFCQAKGVKIDQILKLSFDEARRTMHVEGKSLGPIDLIYCGD